MTIFHPDAYYLSTVIKEKSKCSLRKHSMFLLAGMISKRCLYMEHPYRANSLSLQYCISDYHWQIYICIQ